jgi:hypothetical protein
MSHVHTGMMLTKGRIALARRGKRFIKSIKYNLGCHVLYGIESIKNIKMEYLMLSDCFLVLMTKNISGLVCNCVVQTEAYFQD